jgi:hypothetical protein
MHFVVAALIAFIASAGRIAMWVWVIVALVLLLLPTAVFAQPEKRIALLIGNKDFKAGVGALTSSTTFVWSATR